MNRKSYIIVGISAFALSCLVACDGTPQGGSGKGKPVDMPNPAAEHCAEMGGIPKTRTLPSGDQVATCISPDGEECDAWILMKEKRCEAVDTTQ